MTPFPAPGDDKHTHTPSKETINDQLVTAVLNEAREHFAFDDEVEERRVPLQ